MNLYDRDTIEIQRGHGAKITVGDEHRQYRIETGVLLRSIENPHREFVPNVAEVIIYRGSDGRMQGHSNVSLRRYEGLGTPETLLVGMTTYWIPGIDSAPLAARQVWDYDQSLRAVPIKLGGDSA